ncbi:hypothetical protein ABVK25_002336 [Lepraria finkii]|uniref:Uncharacterized protein n=1 Tax=Lepraria finkii TaxID=1340010 RepID=A0ABR4BHJ2_9LECA
MDIGSSSTPKAGNDTPPPYNLLRVLDHATSSVSFVPPSRFPRPPSIPQIIPRQPSPPQILKVDPPSSPDSSDSRNKVRHPTPQVRGYIVQMRNLRAGSGTRHSSL